MASLPSHHSRVPQESSWAKGTDLGPRDLTLGQGTQPWLQRLESWMAAPRQKWPLWENADILRWIKQTKKKNKTPLPTIGLTPKALKSGLEFFNRFFFFWNVEGSGQNDCKGGISLTQQKMKFVPKSAFITLISLWATPSSSTKHHLYNLSSNWFLCLLFSL